MTYCAELLVVLYLYSLMKETQKQKQQGSKVFLSKFTILWKGDLSQQIFKSRFWEGFLEGNWDNLSYLLGCQFSPVFIGLILGFREFFEDWTHHGIIFWLTCCCHWRWCGLLMRQKESCQVRFMVKATISFMDSSDPIPSIIHFIIFFRIWIIRIFWVISAPCNQFIGIMRKSHLINCLCQLINLLLLTFGVLMQLVTHRSKRRLQNFCLSKYWTFLYCFWWYLQPWEN